jgi:hypothetical protein
MRQSWAGQNGSGPSPKWNRSGLQQLGTISALLRCLRFCPISAPKCHTPICHVSATISGGGQVCDEGELWARKEVLSFLGSFVRR